MQGGDAVHTKTEELPLATVIQMVTKPTRIFAFLRLHCSSVEAFMGCWENSSLVG